MAKMNDIQHMVNEVNTFLGSEPSTNPKEDSQVSQTVEATVRPREENKPAPTVDNPTPSKAERNERRTLSEGQSTQFTANLPGVKSSPKMRDDFTPKEIFGLDHEKHLSNLGNLLASQATEGNAHKIQQAVVGWSDPSIHRTHATATVKLLKNLVSHPDPTVSTLAQGYIDRLHPFTVQGKDKSTAEEAKGLVQGSNQAASEAGRNPSLGLGQTAENMSHAVMDTGADRRDTVARQRELRQDLLDLSRHTVLTDRQGNAWDVGDPDAPKDAVRVPFVEMLTNHFYGPDRETGKQIIYKARGKQAATGRFTNAMKSMGSDQFGNLFKLAVQIGHEIGPHFLVDPEAIGGKELREKYPLQHYHEESGPYRLDEMHGMAKEVFDGLEHALQFGGGKDHYTARSFINYLNRRIREKRGITGGIDQKNADFLNQQRSRPVASIPDAIDPNAKPWYKNSGSHQGEVNRIMANHVRQLRQKSGSAMMPVTGIGGKRKDWLYSNVKTKEVQNVLGHVGPPRGGQLDFTTRHPGRAKASDEAHARRGRSGPTTSLTHTETDHNRPELKQKGVSVGVPGTDLRPEDYAHLIPRVVGRMQAGEAQGFHGLEDAMHNELRNEVKLEKVPVGHIVPLQSDDRFKYKALKELVKNNQSSYLQAVAQRPDLAEEYAKRWQQSREKLDQYSLNLIRKRIGSPEVSDALEGGHGRIGLLQSAVQKWLDGGGNPEEDRANGLTRDQISAIYDDVRKYSGHDFSNALFDQSSHKLAGNAQVRPLAQHLVNQILGQVARDQYKLTSPAEDLGNTDISVDRTGERLGDVLRAYADETHGQPAKTGPTQSVDVPSLFRRVMDKFGTETNDQGLTVPLPVQPREDPKNLSIATGAASSMGQNVEDKPEGDQSEGKTSRAANYESWNLPGVYRNLKEDEEGTAPFSDLITTPAGTGTTRQWSGGQHLHDILRSGYRDLLSENHPTLGPIPMDSETQDAYVRSPQHLQDLRGLVHGAVEQLVGSKPDSSEVDDLLDQYLGPSATTFSGSPPLSEDEAFENLVSRLRKMSPTLGDEGARKKAEIIRREMFGEDAPRVFHRLSVPQTQEVKKALSPAEWLEQEKAKLRIRKSQALIPELVESPTRRVFRSSLRQWMRDQEM